MNPVIGILGGMGPRATVEFERRLLDHCPGGDQDLPTIITVNDGGIPDRSQFLLGRGDDPVPRMRHNLVRLERVGATVVCIPCNTACAPAILSRLQASTSLPIIDLPKIVVKHLVNQKIGSAFVLATAGTIAANTYQQACERGGIKPVVPGKALQAVVTATIKAVKRNDMTQAELLADQIRAEVEASGCQAVILGCTELPMVASAIAPSNIVVADTLDILAAYTVRYTNTVKEITYDARSVHA